MIKKTFIGDDYFIEVINIFHKLFDALVAPRLILVTTNNIFIFVIYIFSNKKPKKQLRCQAIVLDVLNYTCTCHSLNPHINFIHLCVIFFSLKPTMFTLDILKNSFWLSLTTSFHVLPIHIKTSSTSCGLTTTKSLMLRSINRVYVYLEKGFKFFSSQ